MFGRSNWHRSLANLSIFSSFFFLLTRVGRTSAGLNKSSSRSSIHLQPSDFPARRNDQTNLCDRDTSVEKVGRRLKSKFKSHPPAATPSLLFVPRLFRFILELMKHGGGGLCVCARSKNELASYSPTISDRVLFSFFFLFQPKVESKQH